MRSEIRHSGGINSTPYYTLSLVEMSPSNLTVSLGVASLRVEVSETELRDMLVRALLAIETRRLLDQVDAGALTAAEYETALREMDRTPYTASLTKGVSR